MMGPNFLTGSTENHGIMNSFSQLCIWSDWSYSDKQTFCTDSQFTGRESYAGRTIATIGKTMATTCKTMATTCKTMATTFSWCYKTVIDSLWMLISKMHLMWRDLRITIWKLFHDTHYHSRTPETLTFGDTHHHSRTPETLTYGNTDTNIQWWSWLLWEGGSWWQLLAPFF